MELDENGQQKESTGGLAERAYHRDELAANPNLRVDVEYYMANQVCPSSLLSDIRSFCSIQGSVRCVNSCLCGANETSQRKNVPRMRQREDCRTAD